MEKSELCTLIDQYFVDKADADEKKKLVEQENKQIKEGMVELESDVVETEKYKATRSVSVRSSIDEEAWLSILKTQTDLPEGIIKTKEFVDMDALEDAIYNGVIPKDVLIRLNEHKKETEVVTLKVTKLKKKEG